MLRIALPLTLLALCLPQLCAEEKPVALPFGVTVGGQAAKADKKDAPVAVVADAVANDAELAVDLKAEKGFMLIINAFPCDDKGNAKEGVAPAIILGQDTNTVKLSQTMDKKALAAGNYVMNIVAGGATARVKITVK